MAILRRNSALGLLPIIGPSTRFSGYLDVNCSFYSWARVGVRLLLDLLSMGTGDRAVAQPGYLFLGRTLVHLRHVVAETLQGRLRCIRFPANSGWPLLLTTGPSPVGLLYMVVKRKAFRRRAESAAISFNSVA
ncbi:hypothetical protein GY45DRAFT_1328548 [Cubamyces sp. BRFM 1775]|nr:hypothetical protein GY45DRAFT_1328548 [Cubamyces sp. BRFM 1775]